MREIEPGLVLWVHHLGLWGEWLLLWDLGSKLVEAHGRGCIALGVRYHWLLHLLELKLLLLLLDLLWIEWELGHKLLGSWLEGSLMDGDWVVCLGMHHHRVA